MSKKLTKTLGALLSAAMVAQTAAVPSFADAAAVAEYKETILSNLNVSSSFEPLTNSGTKISPFGVPKDGNDTLTMTGANGTMSYDSTENAIKIAQDDTKTSGIGLYMMSGFVGVDGYVDGKIKLNYTTVASVPSTQIVADTPGGRIQNGKLSTSGGEVSYTVGTWLDYRIVYDYDSADGKYDVALYTKKDGKYTLESKKNDVAKTDNNSWGAWSNGGQIGTRVAASYFNNEVLYVAKAKVAKLDSGAESIFPQMVSMSGSGEKLELNVNIDLDPASVTAANLDIPTGTVTNVSYADKKITITGTGLKAAFLTENILSADGMPAKTNSYENKVNDSTLMKLNIGSDFETNKGTNAQIVPASETNTGKVTFVQADAETGERAYLKFDVTRAIWGTQTVKSDGYFDLGLKLTAAPPNNSAKLSLRFEATSGNTMLRIDGNNWSGTGFSGLKANTTDWMDFRMLVEKRDDGYMWVLWLLKNADGVYEPLGSWTNTQKTEVPAYFIMSSDNGVSYNVSQFEYTNAAESTWYPEIIGQESYLDGKLLRIYTNRPLLGSTVNADTVILSSGTATDFITSGSTVTVVGEGLTTAQLTGEVATADGLASGGKTASYTGGAVRHDCGTLTVTLEEALEDWNVAALSNAKLVAGDSTVPATAAYNADEKTITLSFGDLQRLVTKNGRLEKAVYKIVLPNITVDNTVEVSDQPFEFLQISATDTGSADSNGIHLNHIKPGYVAATETSRAYLNGKNGTYTTTDGEETGNTLYYGFTASGHASVSDPFFVDLAVNTSDGAVSAKVANSADKEKAWPTIFDSSSDIGTKYPNAYVAADGFAELRVALTKKTNGGYERTVYCKNADGDWEVAEAATSWKSSNGKTQITGGLNYLTLSLAEGGKIAKFEIYKEDAAAMTPECTDAKFDGDAAVFTYSLPIKAADVSTANIKAYNADGEISNVSAALSADGKTITVTAEDAIRVSVANIHGTNGMPAADKEISRKLGADLTLTDGNGKLITELKGVTKVSANVKFKNKTSAAKTYKIYIAKYNGSTLTQVASGAAVTAEAGAWADVSAELTPSAAFAEGDRVMAFVWDSALAPECEPATAYYSAASALAENALLKARAANGELNVVYIGGSITEGTSASPNWVTLIGESFTEAFGENVVYNYNAGVGGTTSQWGITRFDKDVLQKDPDVVFIEFAVNDTGITTTASKEAMEGMVRQLTALENNPLIVFVYTTTYSDENALTIAAQQEVADYYGIPTINLRDYVWNTYWGGEKPTDEQVEAFWVDKVHPTAAGYAAYADYILANIAQDGFFKETAKKTNPLMENYVKYVGKKLTDSDSVTNNGGWTWDEDYGTLTSNTDATSGSVTIEFEGPMFVVKAIGASDKGKVTVTIEDEDEENTEFEKEMNCYYENGQASFVSSVFNLEDTKHIATISWSTNENRSNAYVSDIYVAKKSN